MIQQQITSWSMVLFASFDAHSFSMETETAYRGDHNEHHMYGRPIKLYFYVTKSHENDLFDRICVFLVQILLKSKLT